MRNWAEMIPDVLIMIVDRVCLISAEDFAAFRVVCTTWRNIAPRELFSYKGIQRPPHLLSSVEKDNGDNRGACNLHSFTTKNDHRVFLPEIYGKRCVETLGWLVIVDRITHSIELFHPFSRVRLPLPRPSTFRYPPKHYHDILHKAVLSASPSYMKDYMLVVIYGTHCRLSFWEPGSQTWKAFEKENVRDIHDILLYKNQFHALKSDGTIYVMEFDKGISVWVVKQCVSPSLSLNMTSRRYLVESKGNLLIVSRSKYGKRKVSVLILNKIDTHRSDLKETKNLGDRALFLGSNASYSIDTCRFPTISRNCIYYTGDCGEVELGIYSLADGKINRYHSDQYQNSMACAPIWVTPSF